MKFWTRTLLIAGLVLLSAAGWWLGLMPGLMWSLAVAGSLVVARRIAEGFRPSGALASMPLWQVALVPMLGLPVGIGLGTLAFILGPGF